MIVPPAWTRDKPTQTGWYWYRGDYDAASADIQPVVTYVNTDGSKIGLRTPCAWQPFMDYDDRLESFTGEWCGPITPPP
jgi:hypothetical protein